jgi:Transposase DDE domain
MRKSTTTLTPAQVYRFAIDFCQPHLDFQAKGKVTATILLTVLFAAAARISSISETCRRLTDVPSKEIYAKALYAQLFCLEELKRKVNAAFVAHLPRALRRPRKRPLRVAIDLTLIPYYGRHPLGHPEIYRSKAKAGTRSFFAYATAYVLLHGQRFTLAVTPVTRSEALKDVLQELLARVSKAGLRPGLLLLDRGFYSVEIIRYLQRARRPFLMPVICHGRDADHPKGPSGSKVFKLMTKSGWFEHTVGDPKKKGRAQATVSICVKRARLTDRHGRTKWDTWVYAYWGITPKRVDWVKRTSRKRFGIETSYRQMNQCRIRTTTRKFNVRFLYVAIGLLLRNLWVWLHHVVLSTPRRGCRRYNWERLRVERMLLWLEQVAAELYGLLLTVTTERDVPQSVVT